MRPRPLALAGLLTAFLVPLSSCEEFPDDPPEATTLQAVGEQNRTGVAGEILDSPLTVRVLNQRGDPMQGVMVDWSVTDGTLSASGTVTDAAGEASVDWTLSQTTGDYEAEAVVTGLPAAVFRATVEADRPAEIQLSDQQITLTAIGATHQCQVTSVRDQYGNEITGVTIDWTSDDETVATVDAAGVVEATGAGSTVVTATADTATATVTVTVDAEVASVTVSPQTSTINVGDTLHLQATATDANGNTIESASFTFTSSNTAVATVDGSGVVTGVGAGEAQVTASSGGQSDAATITVEAAVTGCESHGTLGLGSSVGSTITSDDCSVGDGLYGEVWDLEVAQDTVVVFDMTSTTINPLIMVVDTAGDAIGHNDDAPNTTDAHLELPLPAGTYTVHAIDASGGSGGYTLSVSGGNTPTCTNSGTIALPDTIDGTLDSNDCLFDDGARGDIWTLDVAQDTTVRIDMRSADVDAYVLLFNEAGDSVLGYDDDSGGGVNGRDAQLILDLPAGSYPVLATTWGGGDRGAYTLSAVRAHDCLAGTIVPGETRNGTLESGDCWLTSDTSYVDLWRMELTQQASLQIDMRSTELNAYLTLTDVGFTTEYGQDDDSGGGTNGTDARLTVTLDAGDYYIWANTYPDQSGAYELSVMEASAAGPLADATATGAVRKLDEPVEIYVPAGLRRISSEEDRALSTKPFPVAPTTRRLPMVLRSRS